MQNDIQGDDELLGALLGPAILASQRNDDGVVLLPIDHKHIAAMECIFYLMGCGKLSVGTRREIRDFWENHSHEAIFSSNMFREDTHGWL